MTDNGWPEWKKLVLSKLDTLDRVEENQQIIRQDIAGLKVKAGIWGLVAGSIPVIGAVLMALLTDIL